MFDNIKYDLKAIKERDPAARNKLEIFLLYSGFHAVVLYRIAHWFYNHKCLFIARFISQITRFFTGVEIHPAAKIGKGLVIDHGSGVVIGETTIIGDNCILYQGVTLGGTGKETGKRHPTLGDNVLVGSGAKVLGPFKVGSNSKIASNAVVLNEIPENSTAVGVPARVTRIAGKRVDKKLSVDLDQVHIKDPLSQELRKINCYINKLKQRVDKLEQINKGDL